MAQEQFMQNFINDCVESIDDTEKDRFAMGEDHLPDAGRRTPNDHRRSTDGLKISH